MAKALTREELRQIVDEAYAQSQGYNDGRNYDMSEPREPRFEDDFFNEPSDDEPQEIELMSTYEMTLYGIASTKAHNYAQEYDRSTGRVEDKPNYHALREGYTAGFLEGFAHRLTHTTGE
jgi:hypothetical protein